MTALVLNGALLRIPVGQVEPGPNARGDVGDVSELAVSIAAIGMQVPLIVEQIGGDRYRVLDGHRRLSAVKLAGLPHVDAVVRRAPDDDDRIVRQLAMHAQTREFDPIAQAKALHHLMWERGKDRREIARMVGKSPNWVRDRLALLVLTDEEQAVVARGGMSLAEAVATVNERRAERDGSTAPPPRGRKRHCQTCTCGRPA